MTDQYCHCVCTVHYCDLYVPSVLHHMASEIIVFTYIFSVRILPQTTYLPLQYDHMLSVISLLFIFPDICSSSSHVGTKGSRISPSAMLNLFL
jgi:hypothetical protein